MVQLKNYETYWTNTDWDAKIGGLDNFGPYSGGETNCPCRKNTREHIKKLKGIKTMLDVGCGAAAVEYWGIKEECPKIKYTAVDITPKFVEHLVSTHGIDAVNASSEDLPFEDDSFDLVHTRHMTLHMAQFEKAYDEMIRVAKKYVFEIYAMGPMGMDGMEGPEYISPHHEANTTPNYVYENRYSKARIEDYLKNNKKVKSWEWVDVTEFGNSTYLLKIKVS